MNLAEIKRIKHSVHTNKLDNLKRWTNSQKETNYKQLQILTQEKIENLNRPMTSKITAIVIKNFPLGKSQGPDRITSAFYQTFTEELTSNFHKPF